MIDSFAKKTTAKSKRTELEAKTANVVSRLRWRIQDASQMGFHVRTEPLEGRTADWCQIGCRKVIFLDLTVPAADQLDQLEDVLAAFQEEQQIRSSKPSGVAA